MKNGSGDMKINTKKGFKNTTKKIVISTNQPNVRE